MSIRLHLQTLYVDDQERAMRFYTEVLGFELKFDIPFGNGDRWLTVVAPGRDDMELLLEPAWHPAVAPYREAIRASGLPLASFAVDDIHAECTRLEQAGVVFVQGPTAVGPVITAIIEDTCGNLIQLAML